MKSLPVALLMLFAAGAHAESSPYEFEGYADLRMVSVDSPLQSFMNGGLGLLRFDEDHDGLQLGRLALDFGGPLTESLRAHATMIATDGGENSAIDLTEAFVEWRPYPQSQWTWRTKLGAFYPPISLENRSVAWQSIYSLSPSAINTWIGEEVRTIGMEIRATNLGASAQRPYDVSLIAGVYGWNDPMGVLLFQRGWAIHDHEVPLFGALPRPFTRGTEDQSIEFSQEIDSRAGYYAGLETRWYGTSCDARAPLRQPRRSRAIQSHKHCLVESLRCHRHAVGTIVRTYADQPVDERRHSGRCQPGRTRQTDCRFRVVFPARELPVP